MQRAGSPAAEAAAGAVEALNQACFCITLDAAALARALDSELGEPGLSALVRERCPFLFAGQPVFVAALQLRRMDEVVRAIESVVALPPYREQALAAPRPSRGWAPAGRWAFFSATTFTSIKLTSG